MKQTEQKLKGYLDLMYIMSHSYSTIASYKLSIVNKHKTGFRDYLQETYNIDELEFVEQTKQKKFDVYATLRDHVVYLETYTSKPIFSNLLLHALSSASIRNFSSNLNGVTVVRYFISCYPDHC